MADGKRIDILEDERESQCKIIKYARSRIEEIKIEIGKARFEDKYPIGLVIEEKGIKYKVCGYTEISVLAKKINKDNSIGIREYNFYK